MLGGIFFFLTIAFLIILAADGKSGHVHHGAHLNPLIIALGILALLLYLFLICDSARRTHAHVHAAIMARQDFLEARYSLDRAIPRATHTRKAKRL